MASLSHPNIIKLRGMAAAGTSGFATMDERGYFLLLDRLQCTLEHKIEHWRNFEKALAMDNSGKKRRGFLAERLHVAFDVAAALSYLHDHHIIYRDLKPDNIGFDIRGMLRVFKSVFSFGCVLRLTFVQQAMSRSLTLDWPRNWILLCATVAPSSTNCRATRGRFVTWRLR